MTAYTDNTSMSSQSAIHIPKLPYPFCSEFYNTQKLVGKKYKFINEPRDALLKQNLQIAEERKAKQIEDKIQSIIDERIRLRNMVARMNFNTQQDDTIRKNRQRHSDLINEQIINEKK